ncbi:Serine/threonine protein phosphatase PP2A-2 catalytic subunit, putative [Trichomonas vaginalis G3]|uniref:Serine/threonine-protein phosphatase n=1 Tax=Trichomonas vaginalis (strain ATCC PRA-98 / G3) TaxID=412133 RepID=A2F275_TRIV3|nr:phosphoprotein phosphatase protein [Trichomonas vaginalis G3]EAY01014.1 Serine/threonine protein phosphatase PP2A-2 catalytic subunit, putative [Trichomonas vaginalis G3]KAI5548051.1 phosphoprotein phosphatase protein [Trichomonas vaginalis G3]|eukprot:XP_001330071.1 Serine/threonine protein phosphatase PP2A-2 catalytic subunit [Trichomonas vaginalis G3]
MSSPINADSIMKHIMDGITPTVEEINWINIKAKAMFEKLPNVVSVQPPITICGDIHGQFKDLMELFKIGGDVPMTNYLFLGDYVDRGSQSIETVSYLFCLKLKYPNNITLLRGNHESAGISQIFGFRDEVVARYRNDDVWQTYTNTFNFLPLAAIVGEKILCVHAGLSPRIKTIDDIQKLDRFREIPHEGPMCDLMWSDPTPTPGFQPSAREAGYQFGPDITAGWNKENGLELTARGHQLVMSGLEYGHNNQIVTIFSAPDYCRRCGNSAGILELDENMKRKEIRFETPKEVDEEADQIPKYFSFDLPEDE